MLAYHSNQSRWLFHMWIGNCWIVHHSFSSLLATKAFQESDANSSLQHPLPPHTASAFKGFSRSNWNFQNSKISNIIFRENYLKMTPQNPFEDIKRMHQLSLFGTTTLLLWNVIFFCDKFSWPVFDVMLMEYFQNSTSVPSYKETFITISL